MLLDIRPMDQHQKKIHCQICKVATGIYVTTPKTQYCNILKNKQKYRLNFFSHIYVTTYQTNGLINTKKERYIAKGQVRQEVNDVIRVFPYLNA